MHLFNSFSLIGLGLLMIGSGSAIRVPRNSAATSLTLPSGKTVFTGGRVTHQSNAIFPIKYRQGGKVLTDPVNMYLIYYGNWTVNDVAIVDNFVENLGASEWYVTNTKYYEQSSKGSEQVHVKPNMTLTQTVVDSTYSVGYNVKTGWDVVEYHLDTKNLPVDPTGVYFVLASDDVDMKGFCNQWCGWHDFQLYRGQKLPFGYIGVPPAYCTGCSANKGDVSPNNSPMVDALVDTLAHEIVEAVSDPLINAWMDLRGAENGDKCNWHYGKTKRDEQGGAEYNVILGDRKYLIQQNWDPELQTCVGGF